MAERSSSRQRWLAMRGRAMAALHCPRGGLMVAALLACVTGATVIHPRPWLVWNATASAPVGFYAVSSPRAVSVGDMVIARVPSGWRGLASARAYIPRGVPLVKRVVGAAGDTICARGEAITRDGRLVARRLARDARGRILPWWTGCQTLGSGAVFLLNDSPVSFDGRYLGITRSDDLIGRAIPLWTR